MTKARPVRIATLWNLFFEDQRVSCAVYQRAEGLELRLESASRVILAEPFKMQPRALARTKALRDSLKRRGWIEENPKSQAPNPKSQ